MKEELSEPSNLKNISKENNMSFQAQANEIFSFRGERSIISLNPTVQIKENQIIPPSNPLIIVPAPTIINLGQSNQNAEASNSVNNNQNNQGNDDEEENDEDLEVVSVLMSKILKTHFNFQIFFLFILSFLMWEMPLYIIFSISWLNDLLNFIFYLQKLMKLKGPKRMFTRPALNVLESIVLAVYKLIVILFLKLQIHGLIYPLLLIFCHFIVQILFVVYNKVIKDKSVLTEGIELAYRLFLCTQLTMITLKLDCKIDWEWKDIFWCYWVFFSIMIGVSLGFGIILLGKVYQKCIEKVENYEIKGLFWLFYLSFGITLNSSLTISAFVNFNDEKEIKKYGGDNIIFCFTFISFYTVFLLFYTLVTRADLISFLEKIGTDEDSDDEFEEEEEDEESQPKKHPKKIKVENNPLKFYFPSFLSKTSSTYFKTVNLSFLKSNKSPPNKKQTSKKIKNRNQQKSNSFILSPHQKILTSPALKNISKSPKSISNFLTNIFSKKNAEGISLTEENKNESARGMVNKSDKKKPFPFSLKDHLKMNEVLPHFGFSDMNEITNKSQPDLYLNKSFQFTTSKTPSHENEKPTFDDKSMLDQSVNSCLICFDKKPNAVFMDCGHGGVCYGCATDIFQKTGECYLCRLHIKQVLELDLDEKNGNIIKVKASARLVTDESRIEDMDFQSFN